MGEKGWSRGGRGKGCWLSYSCVNRLGISGSLEGLRGLCHALGIGAGKGICQRMGNWGSTIPHLLSWDKWMDACGNLPGCFPAHLGVLGLGIKPFHTGITWIFSVVAPAGSALGWSLCRQREEPAKGLLLAQGLWQNGPQKPALFSPKMRPEVLGISAERSLCWDREHRDKGWNVQSLKWSNGTDRGSAGVADPGTPGHFPAWKTHFPPKSHLTCTRVLGHGARTPGQEVLGHTASS